MKVGSRTTTMLSVVKVRLSRLSRLSYLVLFLVNHCSVYNPLPRQCVIACQGRLARLPSPRLFSASLLSSRILVLHTVIAHTEVFKVRRPVRYVIPFSEVSKVRFPRLLRLPFPVS